jgi:hypothetical protein
MYVCLKESLWHFAWEIAVPYLQVGLAASLAHIPVDFIFVEVAKFQMELGYATFSYPEPILQAVNRA